MLHGSTNLRKLIRVLNQLRPLTHGLIVLLVALMLVLLENVEILRPLVIVVVEDVKAAIGKRLCLLHVTHGTVNFF